MYICIYVYSHVISVNVPPDGLHLREHFSLSLSLSSLSLSLSLSSLSLSLSELLVVESVAYSMLMNIPWTLSCLRATQRAACLCMPSRCQL